MDAPPAKIGVLDSGIGGLSVLREVHRLMPDHPTIYVADQANLPYGPRSVEDIQGFTESITRFLIAQGAAVIVVACNTASAAALLYLRDCFPDIPFVGMEPAVKPAVEQSQTGVIGVLSTLTTAQGTLYRRVLERYAGGAQVITQVAPGLVTLAETQRQHTPEGRAIIAETMRPLIEAGADTIVLACTHFPFVADAIQDVVGEGVRLIDPSEAIARQVGRIFPTDRAVTPAPNRYYTSGDPAHMEAMLRKLIGVDAPVSPFGVGVSNE